MARLRSIKPDFFTDADIGDLSPLHRLLFPALWCHADREGRLEDKPRELKVKCLPWDNCDVDAMLADLHRAHLIIRYRAEGRGYIAIPGFAEHQRFHKDEKPAGYPPPPEMTRCDGAGTAMASPSAEVSPPPVEVPTPKPCLVSNTDVLNLVSDNGRTEPPPVEPARASVVSAKSSAALAFIPSVPEKPVKDDELWEADDFWAWAQAKRLEDGLACERKPNENATSAWWSAVRMAGFSPKALRLGFVTFANDPYWSDPARKPAVPFKAFVSQWDRFVTQEAVAHAS